MARQSFPPKRDFRSLSVADLLDAREAYHWHLMHLDNVVATAIGLFRIRDTDPDFRTPYPHSHPEAHDVAGSPAAQSAVVPQRQPNASARTLANSTVQPWSWPCLLVFVSQWQSQAEMVRQDPDQVVPRFLYVSDGRVVPTCVIQSEIEEATPPPLENLRFPKDLIGGGYPVLTDVQGDRHVGSIGCLVTDGDAVFALTNRHVTGEAGRPIYSRFPSGRQQIGVAHHRQLNKKPFNKVYPGWPGARALSTLDAGLILVDDLTCWTAQAFGVGELDDPADLTTDSISLDLIGCPVRAYGGASGPQVGEIQALFYRYKAIGGFEYVSDLLIGPRYRGEPLTTRPGDSGTTWFFDELGSTDEAKKQGRMGARAQRLRPIALQWGGHVVLDQESPTKYRYALATFLSTICRELDVDVVRGWNIGHSQYWGRVGHYKIAAKACELVADARLKQLLMANVDAIAFNDQRLTAEQLDRVGNDGFVPLADVADLVWRKTRPKDEANHFADMDQDGRGDFAGKTLLELTQDPAKLDIGAWNAFYASIQAEEASGGAVYTKRGALPFRIWQIYDRMVEYLKAGDVAKFVCAGGIMSHYAGDACQPLHISQFHHGRPERPEEYHVHTKYETDMLDRFAPEVIDEVNSRLKHAAVVGPQVRGGHAAATAILELMRSTYIKLPPLTVVETFDSARQTNPTDVLATMWAVLRDATLACLVDGTLCLAGLWASAWEEGGGPHIDDAHLGPVSREVLRDLYTDRSFLPSYELSDPRYAAALQGRS